MKFKLVASEYGTIWKVWRDNLGLKGSPRKIVNGLFKDVVPTNSHAVLLK